MSVCLFVFSAPASKLLTNTMSSLLFDKIRLWNDLHRKFTNIAGNSRSTVLLTGDSMVKGLFRYKTVWKKYCLLKK